LSLKQKTLTGGLWVGLSVGIAALLQIAQLAALARVLDPTDFGLIAIVSLLIGLVEIASTMGVSNAIVQRQRVTADELSSLHWLNVAVGCMVSVAIYLAAPSVALFFSEPQLDKLVQIVALMFLVIPLGQVYRGSLEKAMSFRQVAVSEVTGAATIFAVSVAAASQYGVSGVIAGTLAGYVVRVGLLFYFGRKLIHLRWHFTFCETKRFLSFGLYQSLDSLVGYVGSNAGSVVIGKAISAYQLGGYNLAYNFAVNTPGRLNPMVTRVMFPAMSHIQDDRTRLGANSLKLISVTGIVSVPVLSGLVVLASEFTEVVLGANWLWVVPMLQVLAIVGYVRSLANPMGAILMATDRMKLGLVINVCKTAATIVLVISGAQLAGAIGVAFALVIMAFLTLVINFALMRHIFSITLKRFVTVHISPLVLAAPMALGMFGVAWIVRGFGNPVVTLGLASVVGGAVYLLTVLLSPSPILKELRSLVWSRRSQGGE
jgi:lipopolysaccharide exporter